MKHGWVNREKTVFLGTFTALVLAGTYALVSEPAFRDVGVKRVHERAPERIATTFQDASTDETRAGLGGASRDIFAAHRSAVTGSEQPSDDRTEVPVAEGDRQPLPSPPEDQEQAAQQDGGICEVPVDFRAVMRTDQGRHFVVLEAKKGSENRYLREGELWPEIGLTIRKITLTSVLLQDAAGRSFVMRDLYARRARPSAAE